VFFNHAAGYEMPHMILAAYMVTGFLVAGIYATGILRGRRDRYHYAGFSLGFVPAAVLTPVQLIVGDTAARSIAADQPVKFASMEYVATTSRQVPEWISGFYVNGNIYAGIKVPYLDSVLVGFGPGTQVKGWDTVPPAQRPPAPWLLHNAFDLMVGLGTLLLLLGLWALWTWWRRRLLPRPRLVTEVGRQPWVVYGLQTTAQAATTNGGVVATLTLVIIGYAVIGAATVAILLLLSRRWRRGDDVSVPYGPVDA
jgi:cytochrome d ubiquinol oxidase subunit I